jgi:Secretion system C-terminal sorting domain
MKKILLTLSLAFTYTLNAQTYLPFPDSAATWVNTYYNVVPIGPTYQNVLVDVINYCTDGDTSINSLTYTKIKICPENIYHAAIRDDNGKVYVVPKDSTQEFLLYDFTVSLGDTIYNVYYESFGSGGYYEHTIIPELIVTEVQIENLDGIDRKVINGMWYEGIGNRQGLFLEPWINISMYTLKLECHSVNGLGIYPNATTEPCQFDLGVEELIVSVELFPNPANETIRVNFINESGNVTFQFTNLLGNNIEVKQLGDNLFDISKLPSGNYFLVISSENSSKTIQFSKN